MCGVRPMARVFIDRDLSTKVAEWFGPQATSEKADEVLADARMLAAIARLTFTRKAASTRMSTAGRHIIGRSVISRP